MAYQHKKFTFATNLYNFEILNSGNTQFICHIKKTNNMKKYLLFVFTFLFSGFAFGQTYFPTVQGTNWDKLSPDSLHWCQNKIDSLYNFLDNNNTKAFLLLKNGKIVLEKYFGTHTETSSWYWASAGKSLTAFITGIALQEGKLSLSDVSSKYLGQGWTSCSPEKENLITIKHHLSMTTGLDDGVEDHFCTLKECLVYKSDAGTRWAYHNGPYTLMDKVIESATGVSLNTYSTLKLKNTTGITGLFIPSGYNNVFYSTARSMARFGLLMLNKGVWNGTVILSDTAYFNQMTHRSQEINKAYGYLWWLNGSSDYMVPQSQFKFNGPLNPDAPTDMYCALGKNGQFVNVVPSEKLVWVRMGEAPDGGDVPFLMNNEIWQYLNKLSCVPQAVSQPAIKKTVVIENRNDQIHIRANENIRQIQVYNSSGSIQYRFEPNSDQFTIPNKLLNKQFILLKIETVLGVTHIRKIVY